MSRDHGLTQWLAFGQQSLGLAICGRGELQAGIDLQEEAMSSLHETGSVLHTTRFRLHLAESFLMLGDLKRARLHLEAGLKHLESHEETYLAAELYRIEALLLDAEGAADEMLQKPIKKGLDLARSQGARLLELRLAMVMTRLLIKKGKGLEARTLLAPVYEYFTESKQNVCRSLFVLFILAISRSGFCAFIYKQTTTKIIRTSHFSEKRGVILTLCRKQTTTKISLRFHN